MLLGGYGLSGLLPDFSSMDALHTINLSNNTLRGNIPNYLATLPELQILNLENNQFNGTIPTSLSTKKGLILLGEWELRAVCKHVVCYSGECPTGELFSEEDKEHSRTYVLHHDFIPYHITLS
ncbi:hypothetical protein OROHE_008058 [Orobanche hederae]